MEYKQGRIFISLLELNAFEVLIHIAYQAANLTLIGETNFDIFVNLYMILLKKSKITMTQCSDNE